MAFALMQPNSDPIYAVVLTSNLYCEITHFVPMQGHMSIDMTLWNNCTKEMDAGNFYRL